MSTRRDPSQQAGATRDWERDLQHRSELATPQDTARGLFFNSVLESVRALGDATSVARCQDALGGQTFVAFFNYPVAQLLRLTQVAMRELSGWYGGPENAARALGRKATADFMRSAVGNAVRMMAGKDVKLFMNSVQSVYRMAAGHGERLVEWHGPRRGHLCVRRNFMPVAYHEGVLEELLARYELKDVKVQGWQTAPLDSEYDFTWE
ncbi:DUF2378 family protein [Vitiosangium sp. GDMCC 1.1324]|uniref:TIGR02265 family protein n=1 Tax=Vitiosangium sp. (strain GDMCC 1.1324) TaxID=2138576 RepID=UPI00130ED03C|nr:DUF2378 family protein [Vitiosangium sp. GDMCC 1.1324]